VLGTSAKTDANGQTTVTFTDTKAQTVNVTATVNGSDLSKPSTFVADSTTAHVTSLTIDVDNSPADGSSLNSATATVTDANGNAVENSTVTWATTNGSAILTSNTSPTDVNGKAIMTLKDATIETVNLTAQVGSTASMARSVHFTGTVTNVTLTTNGAKGNKAAPVIITATTTDAQGQLVSGVKLDWDVLPNNFMVCNSPTSPTNSLGQSTMSCYTNSGYIMDTPFSVTVEPLYTVDPNTPVTDSITYTLSP
ncbi:Ig-like domain-containing protein, partial [Hafnia paralvei]